MITGLAEAFTSGLFGKTWRAVLALLYGRADEAFYLRQIVRMTGIGVGPMQRELKQLADNGIIIRESRGNQVYYQANEKCPIFSELKAIVRKTFGVADVVRESLRPAADRIVAAFVFGSVAGSTDRKASDIDIMVIGDVTFGEISSLVIPAQDALLREINPVVYPMSEFLARVEEKHHFTQDVIVGPKIFLIGDEHEFGRLVGSRLAGASQTTTQ